MHWNPRTVKNCLAALALGTGLTFSASLLNAEAPQDQPAQLPEGMKKLIEKMQDTPKPKKIVPPQAELAFSDPTVIPDAFLKHVESLQTITEKQRKEAVSILKEDIEDPESRLDAMMDALAEVEPKLGDVLDDLFDEKYDKAEKSLKELLDHNDPYVAANARFLLARAYVNQQNFEQALETVDPLTLAGNNMHKYVCYGGEALFLKGVAQAELLQREYAIDTLNTFMKNYPQAPERMVEGAYYIVTDLIYTPEGSLADVQQRMEYAGRKLALKDSGDPTQKQHKTIVKMLDKLIEEAEEKEKGGGGGGGGSSSGGGNKPGQGGKAAGDPTSPASVSQAPEGQGKYGELKKKPPEKGESWGDLNQREREKVLAALKERFPERYQELVKGYSESIANPEEGGTDKNKTDWNAD